MSSFMIDHVSFGCKSPSTKFALKWFFLSMYAIMMSQTCPLRELFTTAWHKALVGLGFFFLRLSG